MPGGMEEREVVVVGGGIAGLAAAWRLRDRDVVLLEAEDRLGGRLESESCGEYWRSYGAHLFPAPGTVVDGMLRDCGLEAAPVWGSMMGLAVGPRKLTRGRVETYPLRLPLRARRELLAHYQAVAARIRIPIMYNNLPGATGVTLDPGQFRELRRTAGVTSLKDTGGDAVAATELIQSGGDDVPTLLNGWDTLTFAALAAGVRAVVWGAATILPEECVALHRLLIDDIDLPAARDLWARLWPLCAFLERRTYPAAVKAACGVVGDTTGPTRPPLLALEDDALAELRELLAHARTGGSTATRTGA